MDPSPPRSARERALDDRATAVDEVLAELRAGGSAEASFRRLFKLYYPAILQFFKNRGFRLDDCLDLTQETFLGTYTSIGSFRGDAGFDTWLFKIAGNVYRKFLRHRLADKRSADEIEIDALEEPQIRSPEPSPRDDLLAEEEVTLLREAIAKMPEQMRQCLVLRVDRGLKYREIAATMKLSVETVKAHLYQARRRLKEELAPHFHPDLVALEDEP